MRLCHFVHHVSLDSINMITMFYQHDNYTDDDCSAIIS